MPVFNQHLAFSSLDAVAKASESCGVHQRASLGRGAALRGGSGQRSARE